LDEEQDDMIATFLGAGLNYLQRDSTSIRLALTASLTTWFMVGGAMTNKGNRGHRSQDRARIDMDYDMDCEDSLCST